MNYRLYRSEIDMPKKQYKIYVYSNGKVLKEFYEDEQYRVWLEAWRKENNTKIERPPIEKVWVNQDQYEIDSKIYNDSILTMRSTFKTDLYKEFDISNNPKADILFEKAIDSEGWNFELIYEFFDEWVELIK